MFSLEFCLLPIIEGGLLVEDTISQRSFAHNKVVNNTINSIYGEHLLIQPLILLDPKDSPPKVESMVQFELLIRNPPSSNKEIIKTLSSGSKMVHSSDSKNILIIGTPIKVDIRIMEEHFLDSEIHFMNQTVSKTITIIPKAIMSLRTKVQTILINNHIMDAPFIERVVECQIENLFDQPIKIISFRFGNELELEVEKEDAEIIGEGELFEFPIRIPYLDSLSYIKGSSCDLNLGKARIKWITMNGRCGVLETNDIVSTMKFFGPSHVLRQPAIVSIGKLSIIEIELFNYDNNDDPSLIFKDSIKIYKNDSIHIMDHEIINSLILKAKIVPLRLGRIPFLLENLFINVSQ